MCHGRRAFTGRAVVSRCSVATTEAVAHRLGRANSAYFAAKKKAKKWKDLSVESQQIRSGGAAVIMSPNIPDTCRTDRCASARRTMSRPHCRERTAAASSARASFQSEISISRSALHELLLTTRGLTTRRTVIAKLLAREARRSHGQSIGAASLRRNKGLRMDGQSLTEFLSLPVKPDETWRAELPSCPI